MFDFVSIIYYNTVEINLLKIQLFSFKFIDENIINNIFILFNDKKNENSILFMKNFNAEIIHFCPDHLKKKVSVIFITDLINTNTYTSDWFSQQFAKLYISKIINSKYYIVLDSKNHFIKNVNKSTFIDEDNKIIMYCNVHNDILINYYKNCFNYFGIKDHNPYESPLYIQTTTPFVFITKECKDLIDYVETKEKKSFYKFFYSSKKYTEFFFYFAWLCFIENDEYTFLSKSIDNVIIGPHDPNVYTWNSWDSKLAYLKENNPSVFSLSSKCLGFIDKNYENKIKDFYNDKYDEKKINDVINNIFS
jgi:hypothetical protein